MTDYYLIDPNGHILNRVVADSPELARAGYHGCQAVTELEAWHQYPETPDTAETQLSRLAFLRRFTAEERIGIRASADPVIVDFLALLDLAQDVSTADPDTQAGIAYLVAQGLLTSTRAESILNG